MLGKAPEAFNAIDVRTILFASSTELVGVVDPVMFAESFERIVALKRVGKVDAAFPGFGPDNAH